MPKLERQRINSRKRKTTSAKKEIYFHGRFHLGNTPYFDLIIKICNRCGQKFEVKVRESAEFDKVAENKKWLCRPCRLASNREKVLSGDIEESEIDRGIWWCAVCRPPRKFFSHVDYVGHHYLAHPD